MIQECSLCGFEVDTDDKLIKTIKKRHVDGRHSPHKTKSQRDGSIIDKAGMGYLIIGEVKWVRVW